MAGECDGEDGNGSAWKAAGCCLRLYLLLLVAVSSLLLPLLPAAAAVSSRAACECCTMPVPLDFKLTAYSCLQCPQALLSSTSTSIHPLKRFSSNHPSSIKYLPPLFSSHGCHPYDLGELTHTLVPCWMPKPLFPRNQCTGLVRPSPSVLLGHFGKDWFGFKVSYVHVNLLGLFFSCSLTNFC